MKKQPVIIFLSLLTLSIISCVKETDLDDCMQQMRIELRWVQTEPLDDNETVPIDITPQTTRSTYTIVSDIYGVNVELGVDEYTIIGCENCQNADVEINGLTVSVPVGTDGMAMEPDIFSAGANTVEVTPGDKSLVIPLPMYRQARPLVIEIGINGSGAPLIQSIEGTLSGIAIERSIYDGFPPVNGQNRPAAFRNGSIHYNFSSVSRAENTNRYSARKNLLGIDGNTTQVLDLEVVFASGESSSLSLDVTSDMAGYHTNNVNEPWYIVLVVEAGVDLEVSIADWESGSESWIIAH